MRRRRFLFLLTFLISISTPVLAQEILVHEAWSVHMESAGGWVAAARGHYGNISVKEVQGGPGISSIQSVVASIKAGNIAFGVDYPENLLRVREKEGIDLVAVSVDFQNSAMRIVSWKPIQSAKDIRGDFAIWPGYEARVKCAVGKGWEKQLTLREQGADIRPWLAGEWSYASAMTYNELITAQREVKKVGKKFYTVDFRDLGINWMDNVVFTTGEIIKKQPEIVQAVVAGRYKGFLWAFENPRETFEILKKVDETVDYAHEMDAVSPLKALMITPETRKSGLGYIHPRKWGNVAKDLLRVGLLENAANVKRVYTEKFPSGVLPR
jgi:NitT/TauT family transport system substrate-binding protein